MPDDCPSFAAIVLESERILMGPSLATGLPGETAADALISGERRAALADGVVRRMPIAVK